MTADTAGHTRAHGEAAGGREMRGGPEGRGAPGGSDLPPPALSKSLNPLAFPPLGAVPVQEMPWNKHLYPPLLFVSVRELPRVAVGVSPHIRPGRTKPRARRGQGASARPGRGWRSGPGVGAARFPPPGRHRRLGGSPRAARRWRIPHSPANPPSAALPCARGGMLQGHVSERHRHLPCALPASFSACSGEDE